MSITKENFKASLPLQYKDIPLHIFDTLDSTNTKARQLTLEGAPHGTVVIAAHQTGGKGRLGRSFFSPKDGIYLSIVIKPDFDISKAVLVTPAAAVAVVDAIESVCNVSASIKWVNDIYVDGKKVCGILSEGVSSHETDRIDTFIVGIGINTSTDGLPDDLLEIAGAVEGDYSKDALAAKVVSNFLDIICGIGDNDFINSYREKSMVIGKTITVYKGVYRKDPREEIGGRSAKALDIDDNGGLMVIYTDGSRETLTSGEISIRL